MFNSEDIDDKVCSVCFEGSVVEGNTILFCDKCNLAVHQICYEVFDIPPNEWYCDACAKGLDTLSVKCELCPFKGGAYKPTVDKKWVHCICANWMPEVFKPDNAYHISNINPARFKLRCVLCNGKGAKIQCSYGKCNTAAHPWCALNSNSGFTHRVIKSSYAENHMDWEIFCVPHASAVSAPPKPKVKAKRTSFAVEDEIDISKEAFIGANRDAESTKLQKKKNLPPRHAGGYARASPSTVNNSSDDECFLERKRIDSDSCGLSSEDGGDNTRRRSHSKHQQSKIKFESDCLPQDKNDNDEDDIHTSNLFGHSPFVAYSFSEWPGQPEEAMDLNHFWNVVSMCYPEDHSIEWFNYMTQSLRLSKNNPHFSEYQDHTCCPLGSIDRTVHKMINGDESVIASLCSEKDLASLCDNEKAKTIEVAILKTINDIRKPLSEDGDNVFQESSIELEPNLYVGREYQFPGFKEPLETGPGMVSIVFEGSRRVACHYEVQVPASDPSAHNGKRQSMMYWVDEVQHMENFADKWEEIKLNDASSQRDNFLPLSILMAKTGVNNTELPEKANVRLKYLDYLEEDMSILLPDKKIIAQDEEDEICHTFWKQHKLFRALMEAIDYKIAKIYDSPALQNMISQILPEERLKHDDTKAKKYEEIISSYNKQRCWKKICKTVVRGVRDQAPDFNKALLDTLPASWTLKVDGRPIPTDSAQCDPDKENDEVQEDSVCMCCFDGSSLEGNTILFCDGCNASMHLACYGVQEVPEGDFFCERCKKIRELMSDPYFDEDTVIKDLIKCCMCPVQHGGLKQLSDGRWVHVCCILWCKEAVIGNIFEMDQIDISHVSLGDSRNLKRSASDSCIVERNTYRSFEKNVPSPIEASDGSSVSNLLSDKIILRSSSSSTLPLDSIVCQICQDSMGYMVQCIECQAEGSSSYFHPLCAWFGGYVVTSELVDPTYLAADRGGIYPACIDFCFHCLNHLPSGSDTERNNQITLRQKYRISEHNLNHFPGMRHIKRKKPKKKILTVTTVRNEPTKDLMNDTYESSICAACLNPIAKLFPESCSESNSQSCAKCKIVIHKSCLSVLCHRQNNASIDVAADENATKDIPQSSSVGENTVATEISQWVCDGCDKFSDSQATCYLCPRKGGMFQQLPDGKWGHSFCIAHRPPPAKPQINAAGEDFAAKKQKCDYCNRRSGAIGRCAHSGCTCYFHPLCGARENSYVRIRAGIREQFCPKHKPVSVFRLPTGAWIDMEDIKRMRTSLDKARLILDLIKRRAKSKKNIFKSQSENFESVYNSHIARANKKRDGEALLACSPGNLDNELENMSNSSDDEAHSVVEEVSFDPDSEHTPVVTQKQNKLKSESGSAVRYQNKNQLKRKSQEPQSDGEDVFIVPTKRSKATIKKDPDIPIKNVSAQHTSMVIPKSFFLKFCGQEIERSATNRGEKEYCKYIHEEIVKSIDVTRPATQIFASQRDVAVFENKLQLQISKNMSIPLNDLIQQAGDSRKKICNTPRKQPKEIVADVAPAGIVSERKRKSTSSQVDHTERDLTYNDLVSLDNFDEKDSCKNALSSFVAIIKSHNKCEPCGNFNVILDNLVPRNHEYYSSSDWKCNQPFSDSLTTNTPEFVSLERNISLLLNWTCDFEIPCNGPMVSLSKKMGAELFVSDMKKRIDMVGLNAYKSDVSIPAGRSSPRGKSSHREKAEAFVEPLRLLSELFQDIPYDEVPNYDSVVRKPVTFEILKDNLQNHRYLSLTSFTRDYFEMLCNGRFISDENSQTWWDTVVLAGFFEHVRNILFSKTNIYNDHCLLKGKVSVVKVEKYSDGISMIDSLMECPGCSEKYCVTGFPPCDNEIIQSKKRTPKVKKEEDTCDIISPPTWLWLCPSCIQTSNLTDVPIKVWWADDSKFYEGRIGELDIFSGDHRVFYTDGEWEFIRLADEAFLVGISKDQASRMSRSSKKVRNSGKKT